MFYIAIIRQSISYSRNIFKKNVLLIRKLYFFFKISAFEYGFAATKSHSFSVEYSKLKEYYCNLLMAYMFSEKKLIQIRSHGSYCSVITWPFI